MEFLKNNLKFWRFASNLSQKEVAEKINISQAGYSKIECGANVPSLITCLKLSILLNFSMDDLKKSVMEELR